MQISVANFVQNCTGIWNSLNLQFCGLYRNFQHYNSTIPTKFEGKQREKVEVYYCPVQFSTSRSNFQNFYVKLFLTRNKKRELILLKSVDFMESEI